LFDADFATLPWLGKGVVENAQDSRGASGLDAQKCQFV
jgi:hypothetical protein